MTLRQHLGMRADLPNLLSLARAGEKMIHLHVDLGADSQWCVEKAVERQPDHTLG